MNDTWESIVLGDGSMRRDALLAARALARLADDNGEVKITNRSLGEAMLGVRFDPGIGRPGDGGWAMAASRGLNALTGAGYLVRRNPGAPRNEPGFYMLTIPARLLHLA